MCRLALLSVLGVCIGQPALAASAHHHHHYGQHHAFRYARVPHIIEMPTHSWGHVAESATPLEERAVENGLKVGLAKAQNEAHEEEKLHAKKEKGQALRHHIGFQHALENAEQKVQEEEKIHEQKEKALASKHHHHLGFQRALANAEKRVHEEEQVREAERARDE